MTTLREAAQQALRALEMWVDETQSITQQDAITALRAALAQQAEPVGEPVAYRHLHEDGWEYHDAPTGEDCAECQALYTAPPQRKPLTQNLDAPLTLNGVALYPRPEPLTEEEIAEATAGVLGLPHEIKVELARAIERAHGIK